MFRLHPPVPVTGGWFRVRIPVPGLSFFILFPRDFPIDDSFLYLYREHSDMLRFNQNFNLYMRSGEIPADRMNPYDQ